MNHLIIRHLSGRLAHQELRIAAADLARTLRLGREPGSEVAFDDADDAVSRQHARIERLSDSDTLTLVDLGSANGSFVNGVRVNGSTSLSHGDTVQLGKGGPTLSVQFDPAPAARPKATRLVDDAAAAGRPTRLADSAADTVVPGAATRPAGDGPARVGRATVERLIGAEQQRSARVLVNALAGVVALAGAFGVWQYTDAQQRDGLARAEAEARIADAKAEAATRLAAMEAKANLSRRVKADYASSTVYIEVSWRLTDSASGRQIYHSNVAIEEEGKRGNLPAYVKLDDGSYEPLLQYEDRGQARPIGGTHTGSGFVVADNGMIMTNRHVAAAWHAPFALKFPGVVVERQKNERGQVELKVVDVLQSAPSNLQRWVPSRSRFFRTRGVGDASSVTGNLSSMMVTFPTSKLRVPATLGTVSPEHDVALIKIDAAAGQLRKVEMRDSYDSLASGDTVAVLGYPGVSATSFVITNSSDQMVKDQDIALVPEVSVNQGIVSKVVRGKQSAQSGKFVSTEGDIFEMSINSTGQGNSGGPVFDGDGKVIGIFSLIGTGGRATLTGAVPIRYGLELLDPTRSAVAMR